MTSVVSTLHTGFTVADVRRLAAFFRDVHAVRERNPGEVVGALLSLGDLAYEIDSARAA